MKEKCGWSLHPAENLVCMPPRQTSSAFYFFVGFPITPLCFFGLFPSLVRCSVRTYPHDHPLFPPSSLLPLNASAPPSSPFLSSPFGCCSSLAGLSSLFCYPPCNNHSRQQCQLTALAAGERKQKRLALSECSRRGKR